MSEETRVEVRYVEFDDVGRWVALAGVAYRERVGPTWAFVITNKAIGWDELGIEYAGG